MKKIFGRKYNFLKNSDLVKNLLKKTSIGSTDLVIEIGPGKGIITQELAAICRKVIAIEKDNGLFLYLKQKFRGRENVYIVLGDFLAYQLPNQNYKVFSNIPYNITAKVIKKITQYQNSPNNAYLIVQKEAAKKFVGIPYTSATQMYALLLKPWFNTEVIHLFKRTDFEPIPQVDSVLMHLKKRIPPFVEDKNSILYRDFIVYAFNQWKPNLKLSLNKIFTHEQFKRLSDNLGFNIKAKPSDLSFEQWLGLFNYFLIGVEDSKKKIIIGSEYLLKRQQSQIHKINRTSTRLR